MWYFEIVETTRRLLLTAVISVISTGSSGQIIAAMLLSITYLEVFSGAKPYANPNVGFLAKMAMYQIFFTYFCSLIVKKELLGPDVDLMLGVLLVIINLTVILGSIGLEIQESYDAIKSTGGGNGVGTEKQYTSNEEGRDSTRSLQAGQSVDGTEIVKIERFSKNNVFMLNDTTHRPSVEVKVPKRRSTINPMSLASQSSSMHLNDSDDEENV